MSAFLSFIYTVLTISLLGPIPNTSYYSSINSDTVSDSFTSYGLIISITLGTVDSFIYGMALYLAMQETRELQNQRMKSNEEVFQYHKYYQSIVVREKEVLNPMRERLELLLRTQTDLHDLIKELAEDNTRDLTLRQNALSKLETLEFIQEDSAMTMKKNIDKVFHLYNINQTKQQSFHTSYNHISRLDSNASIAIDVYILTVFLLLYTYQIARWILQYLSYRNPKKYQPYSFILSVIILSHALGFIYFLHIITLVHCLLPLYVCTWILFLRSLASIYYYT